MLALLLAANAFRDRTQHHATLDETLRAVSVEVDRLQLSLERALGPVLSPTPVPPATLEVLKGLLPQYMADLGAIGKGPLTIIFTLGQDEGHLILEFVADLAQLIFHKSEAGVRILGVEKIRKFGELASTNV